MRYRLLKERHFSAFWGLFVLVAMVGLDAKAETSPAEPVSQAAGVEQAAPPARTCQERGDDEQTTAEKTVREPFFVFQIGAQGQGARTADRPGGPVHKEIADAECHVFYPNFSACVFSPQRQCNFYICNGEEPS